MKVLVHKPELCTACGLCEEACALTWFKTPDRAKSRIHISVIDGEYVANFCDQRGECIDACPTMALKRNKQGVVILNKKLCVSCLSCVGYCPINAMRWHEDELIPFKCVACGKCVEACPEGALEIVERAAPALSETEKRLLQTA